MRIELTYFLICLIFYKSLCRFGYVKATSDVKCETVTVQTYCLDLHYKNARFPNYFNHLTQSEAGRSVNEFYPVIRSDCSESFKLFICSLYFPTCSETPLPCNSLCIENKERCSNEVNNFIGKWPSTLDCTNFPSTSSVCNGNSSTTNDNLNDSNSNTTPHFDLNFHFTCPPWLTTPAYMKFQFSMGNYIVENCGIPCSDPIVFPEADRRQFAQIWIGIFSVLCFISSLFTVLTFTIEHTRFAYPERAIVYIALCYVVISLAYIIGVCLGVQGSCSAVNDDVVSLRPDLINHGPVISRTCVALFVLIYFFTMAAAVWWIVMQFTRFLSAAYLWADEAIDRHAHYYHVVAWTLSAIKTIAILVWGQIDGDHLSGTCFTGVTSPLAKVAFLIAPYCFYYLVGLGFFIAGFVHLMRVRSILREQGSETRKLQQLVTRIGLFSFIYLISSLFVICAWIYEVVEHTSWMRSWHARVCSSLKYGQFGCPTESGQEIRSPSFYFIMLKYFMILIVGILGGFWTWTRKTCRSWSNRCCACRKGALPIETTASPTSIHSVEMTSNGDAYHRGILSNSNGHVSSDRESSSGNGHTAHVEVQLHSIVPTLQTVVET